MSPVAGVVPARPRRGPRLGLEVNMNNDAGWNGSGGPWITPEQSMQKVVWTEIAMEGPNRFDDATGPTLATNAVGLYFI